MGEIRASERRRSNYLSAEEITLWPLWKHGEIWCISFVTCVRIALSMYLLLSKTTVEQREMKVSS